MAHENAIKPKVIKPNSLCHTFKKEEHTSSFHNHVEDYDDYLLLECGSH